jgi:acetylornithine deacetylase
MGKLTQEQKEKSLAFLEKLISFDTSVIRHGEDGQEKEAQLYMAEYLRQLGCSVDIFEPDNEKMKTYPGYNEGHSYVDRPNVVGRYKGSGGGKSLILNGHMDTMPSGDLAMWHTDPWTMTQKEGKLYGLGTDDMKGGLSALVLAMEFVLSEGFRPRGDIILESVVDEEGGGNGTLACVERGYRADGAIIAEGSNLEVFAANRGAWLVSAEITGRPIHASLRGFGENAIEKMVKVILAIRELETKWMTTKRHPLLAPPTMNIGCIEGGVAASTVAERCLLKFDVEYFPSEIDKYGVRHTVDKDEVVKEVEAHLNLMAAGDEWLREHPITFQWYQDCPPFETDVNDPLVQTLAAVTDKVTGKRVISGMTAGCDARHLTNIAKVPTVVYGPGTCHNAHVVNEYLPREQYFQAIETYMEMIREWTK